MPIHPQIVLHGLDRLAQEYSYMASPWVIGCEASETPVPLLVCLSMVDSTTEPDR